MRKESGHTQETANAPTTGKMYQCLLNGMPLYDARIENVTGCWATVEVVQPLPGPHENNYRTGQTFDIRISSYTFHEKA